MKLYTPKKKKKKIGRRILAIAVLFLIVFSTYRLANYSIRKFSNWSLIQLSSIELEIQPPVQAAEIIELSGFSEGKNIFSVSTVRAEYRILSHPWVRSVDVKRKLPSSIHISTENKTVRVIAKKGDSIYYIDEYGKKIARIIPGLRFDVPIVEVKDGDYVGAIKIIDRISAYPWIKTHEISELIVSDEYLILFLLEDKLKIYLSKTNLEQSLINVKKVMSDMKKRGETASSIDASISENRVFVKNIRKKR